MQTTCSAYDEGGIAERQMRLPKPINASYHTLNLEVIITDRNELMDIEAITFDSSMTGEERVRHFLEQIKDPYHFSCQGVVVHTSFANRGVSLEECVSDFLKSKMLNF